MSALVITRSDKSIIITTTPKSPSNNISSPSFSSAAGPASLQNLVVPRAPVVHFFICDYGNAKVKSVSDTFIELLVSNGIKVFPEKYATHQPGFQVNLNAMNSKADFFVQIHSKTAGKGHVRLFLGGQPKRMSIEESVAEIWAWWRLICGAINKNEIQLLSGEKINYALKGFSGIEAESLSIDGIQKEIRDCILLGNSTNHLSEKISGMMDSIEDGKNQLMSHKQVCLDWTREPGVQISICAAPSIQRGLSIPLRDLLVLTLDNAKRKLQKLYIITDDHSIEEAKAVNGDIQSTEVEDGPEVDINLDDSLAKLSWGTLLESVRDESFGSSHIGSSDNGSNLTPGFLRPPFFLDEF